jgi:superoxide dismutase, Fe-Mn family
MNRREFLVAGSITGAALLGAKHAGANVLSAGDPAGHKANLTLEEKTVAFTVPPLPYSFDALEPYIDAKTMEIHHDKHQGPRWPRGSTGKVPG